MVGAATVSRRFRSRAIYRALAGPRWGRSRARHDLLRPTGGYGGRRDLSRDYGSVPHVSGGSVGWIPGLIWLNASSRLPPHRPVAAAASRPRQQGRGRASKVNTLKPPAASWWVKTNRLLSPKGDRSRLQSAGAGYAALPARI